MSRPAELEPASYRERPAEPPPNLRAAVSDANHALEDVYFDFDSTEVNSAGFSALRQDAGILAGILKQIPSLKVVIEGHCDERGSAEYNLGLGDRRARRASDVLREFGPRLPAVEIVSYGKEAPQCTEQTESCWQRNRRAHVVLHE